MNTAPQYIVGEWDDEAWRVVAAKPANLRTGEEAFLFSIGPRTHPYGVLAHTAPIPGVEPPLDAIWPSKEAFDDYHAGVKGIGLLDNALAANAGPPKAD